MVSVIFSLFSQTILVGLLEAAGFLAAQLISPTAQLLRLNFYCS
jgi:hypothetical protein